MVRVYVKLFKVLLDLDEVYFLLDFPVNLTDIAGLCEAFLKYLWIFVKCMYFLWDFLGNLTHVAGLCEIF